VGNGQAAAGFSAVFAPVLAAVDGVLCCSGVLAIGSAWLASGGAIGAAFFFFPAFFFFLADFFLPAARFLPAVFNDLFFLRDAFFFFFFLPPFFDFFFAMLYSFKVVEQKKPGAFGPDYPTSGGVSTPSAG
jgi:hypothetical protein